MIGDQASKPIFLADGTLIVPRISRLASVTFDVGFYTRDDLRAMIAESLRADITSRLQTIRELQTRLASHRDEIRCELLASYQQRVQEIAKAAGIEINQDRIAQEVVIMVEKGDVAEELTRLAHHVEQAEKAVSGTDAAGKKLDFLSQEMLREVNTMGSKSRSAALRTLVVELKTEVERIREQVQNVE